MILHNDPSFLIYFGNSKDCCVKSDFKFSKKDLDSVRDFLSLKNIVFLKQTHSSDGICLNDLSQVKSFYSLFEYSGDFIVTNLRRVGIGILTADCLPVVIYDPVGNVISIVHAGWRGCASDIITRSIEIMQNQFNSKIHDLVIYFGSCAKVCCYKIKNDFLKNFENFSFVDQVIFKKEDHLFFDLLKFAELKLLDLGLKIENLHKNYNNCTICDLNFHSYRRDKEQAGRQATIVALR